MKEYVVFKKIDNALCRIEEFITVIGYFSMTLVVLWSVLCRYVLKIPFVYGDEAARYLTIYSVFIGVSIGVRKGAHLGVEAGVDMLPSSIQEIVRISSIVFTSFMFFALSYVTLEMTMKVYSTGQHSSSLNIPMWMIYMSMPLGMFLSGIREVQVLAARLRQYRRIGRAA